MRGCRRMRDTFRIIETFGRHPGEGARRIERHLARMERTARALGIPWDTMSALAAMDATEALADQPAAGAVGNADHASILRCRLTLDRKGQFDLTTAPLDPTPQEWRVGVAPDRVRSDNQWLRVKTTNRPLHDRTRREIPAGIDELLFLNERGHLCEGTITSLFADLGEGLVTPPLTDGLLPGILRETMLENREAKEAHLTPDDLAGARSVHVGNSLHGLIRARLHAGGSRF